MEKKKDLFSWKKTIIGLLTAVAAVIVVILYTDSKEYFEADKTNNHVERKWRSFYRFTQKEHRNADIVILGNSHASSGFDPYTISAATGCYCFILNAPGAKVVDVLNNLREVLKYSKPKMVLIETYSLFGDGGGLEWGVIQSINAKKGFFNRVHMLPGSLPFDSWPKALSSTIRNHDFLLTNREQIKRNIQLMGKEKNPERRKYDLGRFSHGQGEISPGILEEYAKQAAVGPEGITMNKKTVRTLGKIYALCKKNGIKLGFITAPVYEKNYADYSVVQRYMNKVFSRYPDTFWFDLQGTYDRRLYGVDSFMDEYGLAQHNSAKGMGLNTNSLVQYLMDNYSDIFPDRREEKVWQKALSDYEEKFRYMRWPEMGWEGCRLIIKDKEVLSVPVKEFFVHEEKSYDVLYLRIARKNPGSDMPKAVLIDIAPDGEGSGACVKMDKNICSSPEWYLYTAAIPKGVEVNNLRGIFSY